jgi:translation initiation factor IF-2
MAETTEKTGDKKLSITSSKTLTLKPRGSETGVVRQSFSHGRTKSVVVEKVRSRGAPGKPATTPRPPPAGPVRPRRPRRRQRRPSHRASCCTR